MLGQSQGIYLQRKRSLAGFLTLRFSQPVAIGARWNDELKGMSRNVYAVI